MSCSSRSLSGATATDLAIIGSKTLIDGVGSPHTYSLPDVGADSAIILSAGAQTITGIKTFGVLPVFSGLSSGLLGIDTKTMAMNSVASTSTTGMSLAFNGSTFTIDTPQDLRTTASPAFTQITADTFTGRYKMSGLFTTSKSIPNQAFTVINSGITPTIATDPAGSISTTGFTIKKAGNYDLNFCVRVNDFGANSTATAGIGVYINGTLSPSPQVWGIAERVSGRISISYAGCFPVALALNDVVTLGIWQNSGGATGITWFSMRWALSN